MSYRLFTTTIFCCAFLWLKLACAFSLTEQKWRQAIDKKVEKYRIITSQQLKPLFEQQQIPYPPKRIALLAFKKERQIELWAKDKKRQWHYIKSYPLTATSGGPGPKLRLGDGQIPEGIYQINVMNPFSSQHLSMRLNYPNAFDRYHGRVEHRRKLGNNIFIHGRALSAGCLAIGDKAIEELFVLVALVGRGHVSVVIAPNDMRIQPPLNLQVRHPRWVVDLNRQIMKALKPFKPALKQLAMKTAAKVL